MAKRYYPQNRAPRAVKKALNNKEAWDRIHKQLAELMTMTHFYRTNDSCVKMVYGGNLKSLSKTVIRIQNIINSYGNMEDDIDVY